MDQENQPQTPEVRIEVSSTSIPFPEMSREHQVPEQDPASPDLEQKENGEDHKEVVIEHEIVSDRYFSQKQQRIFKIFVFGVVIGVLLFGRFSVPSNEVACVQDKLFELLEPITRWLIATPGNEGWRNAFQILDSALIDIVFLGTLGYWIFYGKSSRLIVVYALFYGIRAVIQQLFYLPFPDMYWWYDPGFPSLVVPYGRGSDFFFSGHSGFVLICFMEWRRLGFKKLKWFCGAVLALTVLTLLVYRIHYIIDIFTGVFFADYIYLRVSKQEEWFDTKCINIAAKVRGLFKCKNKVVV